MQTNRFVFANKLANVCQFGFNLPYNLFGLTCRNNARITILLIPYNEILHIPLLDFVDGSKLWLSKILNLQYRVKKNVYEVNVH